MQNGFDMARQLPGRIITSFFQRGFAKDVSILMSGTAVAQGLTLAMAPILSRLYNPTAFGVFALFTSIVSMFSVIATWRYELAIVLPREDEDAANILALACSVVVVMSACAALTVAFAGDRIALLLGSPQLKPMLWWLPLTIMMSGFYNALNYWSTRRKHFSRLSVSQLFRAVASNGTQVSAGFANLGTTGLVGGQAAGQTVATTVLGYQIWSNDKHLVRNSLKLSNMKRLATTYSDFPKYSSWQALVSSISQNMMPFLLAYFFSSYAVGLYAISLRFLHLPTGLIGESVRQVFFPRANEAQQSANAYSLLIKATVSLFTIGLVPAIIVILFGPSVFSFILGKKWHAAGVYAQLMAPWLLLVLVNPPSVAMIQILNLQSKYLAYELTLLVLRVIAMSFGAYLESDIISIACSSGVGFVFNMALILYVVYLTRSHNRAIKQEGYST